MQRVRKPPPQSGVLSDEAPTGSIVDGCRRTDRAPPPPLNAAASLRRAVTQRWFALRTGVAKPPPVPKLPLTPTLTLTLTLTLNSNPNPNPR